jgi:hypothetical protein
MRKYLLAAALCACAAPTALTQQQAQKQFSFKFAADGLYRNEWTREFFDPTLPEQYRWRIQARPRLELGVGPVVLGVGGEFGFSDEDNVDPRPALQRDNYDSKALRVDLAFLSVKPASWLRVEGGRFFMPVFLTEMIWDRDLRPQGGALTLEFQQESGSAFRLIGLAARGSHVFEDEKTDMLIGSASLDLVSGFQLTGSYVAFKGLDSIEPMLRRQNTRVAGRLVREYGIVDVNARLRREKGVETELVADYCWNTKADDQNKGLWLALRLGSLELSRARGEYVYAKVDRDATLAAYAADDFFWETGWEGHKAELGVRVGPHTSLHGTAQWQRFKDSPNVAERDHWLKRYRLDLRFAY